jgi:hypothetical protein
LFVAYDNFYRVNRQPKITLSLPSTTKVLLEIKQSTRPKWYVLQGMGGLQKKTLMAFVASTFTFLLNTSQQSFYNDLTYPTNKKIKVTNPVSKLSWNYSIPYL